MNIHISKHAGCSGYNCWAIYDGFAQRFYHKVTCLVYPLDLTERKRVKPIYSLDIACVMFFHQFLQTIQLVVGFDLAWSCCFILSIRLNARPHIQLVLSLAHSATTHWSDTTTFLISQTFSYRYFPNSLNVVPPTGTVFRGFSISQMVMTSCADADRSRYFMGSTNHSFHLAKDISLCKRYSALCMRSYLHCCLNDL